MILCLIAFAGLGVSLALAADEKKPATSQAQVDTIVKAYLTIEKSLTTDKTDGVSDELSKMRTAATALSETGDGKIRDQAKAIAGHAEAKPKGSRTEIVQPPLYAVRCRTVSCST